jgi:ABC-2 type transport system ATP-binding protein
VATTVIRALDAVGALVDDVVVHPPSLDDVFFALTGAPSAASSRTSSGASGGSSGAPAVAAQARHIDADQLQGVS